KSLALVSTELKARNKSGTNTSIQYVKNNKT
ncbi:MAG: hypothetical protein ACI90V_010207, partial [Bacillariaceae sp.]